MHLKPHVHDTYWVRWSLPPELRVCIGRLRKIVFYPVFGRRACFLMGPVIDGCWGNERSESRVEVGDGAADGCYVVSGN